MITIFNRNNAEISSILNKEMIDFYQRPESVDHIFTVLV